MDLNQIYTLMVVLPGSFIDLMLGASDLRYRGVQRKIDEKNADPPIGSVAAAFVIVMDSRRTIRNFPEAVSFSGYICCRSPML
ncbi:hypothetical protein E2542_SST06671 [Spatholobus suberectus]|nr:hypothetical protein E2542_SST06671 [Spatholobus suberectus]